MRHWASIPSPILTVARDSHRSPRSVSEGGPHRPSNLIPSPLTVARTPIVTRSVSEGGPSVRVPTSRSGPRCWMWVCTGADWKPARRVASTGLSIRGRIIDAVAVPVAHHGQVTRFSQRKVASFASISWFPLVSDTTRRRGTHPIDRSRRRPVSNHRHIAFLPHSITGHDECVDIAVTIEEQVPCEKRRSIECRRRSNLRPRARRD